MQKDFAVDFLESNLEPPRPGQSLVDVFDKSHSRAAAPSGGTTKIWQSPKFKKAALYFVVMGMLVLGLAILLHPPLLERPGGELEPKQVAMWVAGSGLVAGVASLVVVKP